MKYDVFRQRNGGCWYVSPEDSRDTIEDANAVARSYRHLGYVAWVHERATGRLVSLDPAVMGLMTAVLYSTADAENVSRDRVEVVLAYLYSTDARVRAMMMELATSVVAIAKAHPDLKSLRDAEAEKMKTAVRDLPPPVFEHKG